MKETQGCIDHTGKFPKAAGDDFGCVLQMKTGTAIWFVKALAKGIAIAYGLFLPSSHAWLHRSGDLIKDMP